VSSYKLTTIVVDIAQKPPKCKDSPLTPIVTKISFSPFSARWGALTPKRGEGTSGTRVRPHAKFGVNRAAAGRVIVDKKRTNKQNKTNKQTYSKTYTSLFALTSELRVKSKNHICIHNNNNAKPCTKSIRFDKYSIIL